MLQKQRVSIAWLLLIVIVSGAAVIVWKLAVHDAPPGGTAFVQNGQTDQPSATITPFGGGATRQAANPPSLPGASLAATPKAASTAPSGIATLPTPGDSAGALVSTDSPTTVLPLPPPVPTTNIPTIVVYVSGDV